MTDEDLRSLPPAAPPCELTEHVRRRAHGELALSTRGGWLPLVTRAWTRVVLPAAVVTTVVGYLSWAVGTASALYR
jgi:hypothetical protein